jgi:ATP-dependent DNA ligase
MTKPQDIFMLCESLQDLKEVNKLDRDRFKANFKYDGNRVMAIKKENDIVLFNRGGNTINNKFPEIVKALSLLSKNFIIDGEIISMDNNFNELQKRALTKDKTKIELLIKEIPVKFMVFDILFYDNKDVKYRALKDRLVFLNELFIENYSEFLELVAYEDIDNCLMRAIETNGEGIIIKDMTGIYESKRSRSWIKHKLFKETTLNITGYTENPAGLRLTDDIGNAVQCSGTQAQEVKNLIEVEGYVTINIQYLTQSKEGRYRFPSFRGVSQ